MPLRASRCIIHIDLDAFYAQVESKRLGLAPDIPLCVQQWNSLIAVNYAARALGISRFSRASEIRSKYPQCVLAHCATVGSDDCGKECADVDPTKHKISLERYRVASAAIFEVFATAGCMVERASIDEAYFEVSALVSDALACGSACFLQPVASLPPIPSDFVAGFHAPKTAECNFLPHVGWVVGTLSPEAESDTRIAVAAAIAAQLRAAVFSTLGYTCSAGIAHSKLLAKLGSAMHKPSGQTTIPIASVDGLMRDTPLQCIRYFGGKLGNQLKAGGFNTAGDVIQGDRSAVAACVGEESVAFVLEVCSGQLEETVTRRGPPATMLASKSFLQPLHSLEECHQWLRVLACELVNRHQKDESAFERWPTKLSIYYRSQYTHPSVAHRSNSTPAMKVQASGDSYFCNRTGEMKIRSSSGASHVCSLSPRGGIIDADCIINAASSMLSRAAASAFPCKHLALTLSGFVAKEGKRDITSFFGAMAAAAAATAASATAAAASATAAAASATATAGICRNSAGFPLNSVVPPALLSSASDDEDQREDDCPCSDASNQGLTASECCLHGDSGGGCMNAPYEAACHTSVDVVHCSDRVHASPISAAAESLSAEPLPSAAPPSLQQVAATVNTARRVISAFDDEDECMIIETPSTRSSSSAAVAALRQLRCAECNMWLLGDSALRLHMDEHVAQKLQRVYDEEFQMQQDRVKRQRSSAPLTYHAISSSTTAAAAAAAACGLTRGQLSLSAFLAKKR